MRYLPWLAFSLFALAACQNKAEKETVKVDTAEIHAIKDSTQLSVDSALNNAQPSLLEKAILPNAHSIVKHLKDKNFSELAKYVSPANGLRFSSNGYIAKEDIKFTREEVAVLWNDEKKHIFPSYSDEGKPAKFRDYYASDVYDKDFITAKNVELNKLSRGPTPGIFNLKDSYPQGKHVDFYIPAPKDSELDWATLRLIFADEGGKWYLRHVVHDNWTP